MKLQLDSLRFVRVKPVNLFHVLYLGNKRNGGRLFSLREEGKAAKYLEELLMDIF
jgi:hypothetical protein